MTSPPSSMVGDLLREAEAAAPGSDYRAYCMAQADVAATMLVAHQLAVIAGRLDRMTRPTQLDMALAYPGAEVTARQTLGFLHRWRRQGVQV